MYILYYNKSITSLPFVSILNQFGPNKFEKFIIVVISLTQKDKYKIIGANL